ncbi:MAG: winged helix-turn-helix domain-containing protein [Desulfurococcales archaeon]|nr:winged helix-turn-helix domain-containing protein [Desulfurococcales archaeon]
MAKQVGLDKAELERALRHLLHCFKAANPEVSARIVMLLMDNPQGLTVSDIKERLNVSYAMALRIVSELESLGVVETDRVKVVKGRGRARKLAKLSKDGISRLASQCIEQLQPLTKI